VVVNVKGTVIEANSVSEEELAKISGGNAPGPGIRIVAEAVEMLSRVEDRIDKRRRGCFFIGEVGRC
jgi:bacteriocin-like protein